jgi:hypothetical protein
VVGAPVQQMGVEGVAEAHNHGAAVRHASAKLTWESRRPCAW